MGEKPVVTKKKGSFTAILGCIGVIFLGCCLNNIALEFIIRLVLILVTHSRPSLTLWPSTVQRHLVAFCFAKNLNLGCCL